MTRMKLFGTTIALVLMTLTAPGMDCETGQMPGPGDMMGGGNGGGGNNGGGNNMGDDPLGLVLTSIPVHVMARIEAGDDLIVYTEREADDTPGNVNYIVPSAGDTAGRGIPNAADYDNNSFLVAGNKIILVGGPEGSNAVSVYDPATDSIENIPASEVTLSSVPVSNYGPAFMDVDGSLVATVNLTNSAGADGMELIRVIDVSGATAQITKFTVNPDNDNTLVPDQIHVDAETRTVVAARQIPGKFWVYDLDDPTAAPMDYDVTSVNGPRTFDTPFAYDDGMMLFIGRDGSYEYPFLIDLLDPTATPESLDPSEAGVTRPVIVDNRYAYLANGPTINGTLDGGMFVASEASIDGGGFSGKGNTLAYGMLGTTEIWIIGGQDNIGTSNALQYSTGNGDWMTVPDPRDASENLAVGDVHTNESGAFLGFKYESDDDSFLGYAILN